MAAFKRHELLLRNPTRTESVKSLLSLDAELVAQGGGSIKSFRRIDRAMVVIIVPTDEVFVPFKAGRCDHPTCLPGDIDIVGQFKFFKLADGRAGHHVHRRRVVV